MSIVVGFLVLVGLHHIVRPLYRPLGRLLLILAGAWMAGHTFASAARRAWETRR